MNRQYRHEHLKTGLRIAAKSAGVLAILSATVGAGIYGEHIITKDAAHVREALPDRNNLAIKIGSACVSTLENDKNQDLTNESGLVEALRTHSDVCKKVDLSSLDLQKASDYYKALETYDSEHLPDSILTGVIAGIGLAATGIAALLALESEF